MVDWAFRALVLLCVWRGSSLSCSMSETISPDHIRAELRGRDRRVVERTESLRAAVLVPVIVEAGGTALLFTKRTELVETHKGQVSFPGGVVEETDRDIIQTALREAEEEVGIAAGEVEIVGILDDLATPTGFVITPVVGLVRLTHPLQPNADEVADVFQVPLSFFAQAATVRTEYRMIEGMRREVWYYDTDRHTIWGATAAIIRSLLTALGEL